MPQAAPSSQPGVALGPRARARRRRQAARGRARNPSAWAKERTASRQACRPQARRPPARCAGCSTGRKAMPRSRPETAWTSAARCGRPRPWSRRAGNRHGDRRDIERVVALHWVAGRSRRRTCCRSPGGQMPGDVEVVEEVVGQVARLEHGQRAQDDGDARREALTATRRATATQVRIRTLEGRAAHESRLSSGRGSIESCNGEQLVKQVGTGDAQGCSAVTLREF